MNKITTILAGVALAAAVAAPASASNGSGFFSTTSTLPAFSFAPNFASYTLTDAPVVYVLGTTVTAGTLTLSNGTLTSGPKYTYSGTKLVFTGGGQTFTEFGTSSVNLFNGTTFAGVNPGFSGGGHKGDLLNLTYASAPVPEASTVVSFGALLALGGLALLRRKSVARAS